ncbi:MAG: ABC transporter substrate-binding protein [Vulcanimicrobiaceae bacterium]
MKRPTFLAGAVAAGIAGCARVQHGGTLATAQRFAKAHWLRIADGTGDIDSLNPHLFTEATLLNIAQMTMAYLVRYDAANRPIPELATVVPTQGNGGISADGTRITWHLRKGVRWSDGAPFTGDDVVFSTKVVLNPANNEVGRDGWNLITKMEQPDPYTVIFQLKKPYSSFLPTFFGSGGANPCILPKHLLEKYPNINNVPYNSKPVGIGPFRVTAWRRGDAVEMEANPYYWRGLPKLHRVTYKLIPSRDTLLTLMQTGEVDLWPYVPASFMDRVKQVKTLDVIDRPSFFFSHLSMNVSRPLVADVRVRHAIRHAIDRHTILSKIGHGYGILQESFMSPASPIAPANIAFAPYDPARARVLLDEAGWKEGPDRIRVKAGKHLKLQFAYYTGSPGADQEVELMREMLRAVGIEIETRKYAPALFFAPYQSNGIVYKGDWDLTTFAWQLDPGGDISNLFECNQIPPNGQNIVHYCNPQADRWMNELKATYDVQKHKVLLDKEITQIVADTPLITLSITLDGYAYNRMLTGFVPNSMTAFDHMMHVDIV